MNPPRNLSELIIADARERGLRHFFGLPGAGAPLNLIEAGRRFGVGFVSVAHESSAAIIAAYHGAFCRTAGLALAIKGVGAGNLAGGACNAYFERMPLIALCERAPTAWKQREMMQHCSHAGLFGGITKMQVTLIAEDAPSLLREAAFAATDGRPGVVLVDLPSNLGTAPCGGGLPSKAPCPHAVPAREEIEAAAAFLKAHRRPVVIINDEALGTMKSRQKSRGLPDHALDVFPMDFAAIARACGLHGVTVDNPEAFEKELSRALKADRTTLIDARVDPKPYQDSFGPTIGG